MLIESNEKVFRSIFRRALLKVHAMHDDRTHYYKKPKRNAKLTKNQQEVHTPHRSPEKRFQL